MHFLLTPYVAPGSRAVVAYFFPSLAHVPVGIFSRLRDHVIRASRAKFPLAEAFVNFVFPSHTYFFSIDTLYVRYDECKIQAP